MTPEEMNQVIYKYIKERELKRIRVGQLYDDARHFTKKEQFADILPFITPMEIVDPVTRTAPQIWDSVRDGLKTIDSSMVNDAGQELLPAENVSIAATTVVQTTAFSSLGHKNIVVTIVNPTWTTNPTGLTVGIQYTDDAFDTNVWNLIGYDGNPILITIPTTDGTSTFFVIPTTTQIGTLASGEPYTHAALPSGDLRQLRLQFTPAGAAEAQNASVGVFGCKLR